MTASIDPAVARKRLARATTSAGGVHFSWRVDDPERQAKLRTLLSRLHPENN
ncbi:hypothetical protein [Nocardia stercoris]|uniref:hypothetical protein n=1 Tax=Nocardia stercoris TaxID=2483361 RepID=UPI00131A0EE8|nr:hypothetical protein [Nocardia stercoris]